MRALKFYQIGSLDDLHVEEVSVPIPPAAGEVLVEVKAAATSALYFVTGSNRLTVSRDFDALA